MEKIRICKRNLNHWILLFMMLYAVTYVNEVMGNKANQYDKNIPTCQNQFWTKVISTL